MNSRKPLVDDLITGKAKIDEDLSYCNLDNCPICVDNYVDGEKVKEFDPNTFDQDFDIPDEMYHWIKVLEMGANKHGANNWLEYKSDRTSFKGFHDAAFHHLARSFTNDTRFDSESGLDHLLHLACNALMAYTLIKRGIIK